VSKNAKLYADLKLVDVGFKDIVQPKKRGVERGTI
jgi:hypothetical protein